MSGLANTISTDLSGLSAFRKALNTVSNNIANVNTPGYARRSIDLSAAYMMGQDNLAGLGVDVGGVDRLASQLADTRLRTAMASQGRANILVTTLEGVESSFTGSGSIRNALDQFFSDAKVLATKPADAPTRQTLLADARQVSAAFKGIAGGINDSLRNLVQQGQEQTSQTNTLLQQLAQINQLIRKSRGTNNSLRDRQAQALQKLSTLLGVNVLRNANGTVRVSVRGLVLVGSAGANTLKFQRTQNGQQVQITLPNGRPLGSSTLSGEIGGTIAAYAQSLQQLQGLNRMAAMTAGVINAQNAQGLTLSGQQGGQLLTMPTPTIISRTGNTGTASLSASISDLSKLASGSPYDVVYKDGQWTATNQATGKAINLGAGHTFHLDGTTVNVNGTPQNGDRFSFDPVSGASANLAVATNDLGAVAAAAPYVVQAGQVNNAGEVIRGNAGQATISSGKVATQVEPSDVVVDSSHFGQPVVLQFTDATHYQIKTEAGDVLTSGTYDANTGKTIDFAYPDGLAGGHYWVMQVSGQPVSGDTFTLRPGGPQSGANADALGRLPTQPVFQGASLTDLDADLVAQVGSAKKSAQNSQDNAKVSVANAQKARSQISGVSLDQQAAQLMQYSQAYQASAKALSTVNSLFESLLNIA